MRRLAKKFSVVSLLMFFLQIYYSYNKDENVHILALSAIREEISEKERKREKERERKRERERERNSNK